MSDLITVSDASWQYELSAASAYLALNLGRFGPNSSINPALVMLNKTQWSYNAIDIFNSSQYVSSVVFTLSFNSPSIVLQWPFNSPSMVNIDIY